MQFVSRIKKFKSNDRGASFVEAVIVLPVLLMAVFGIIQLGYIIAANITLRNASAAGARVGIANTQLVAANRATFNTMVSDAVTASLAPLQADLAVVPTPVVSADVPPKVSVTVNYTLPLFPGSQLVLGQSGNFNMSSSTTMR